MTEKLYLNDSYLKTFTAEVLERGTKDDLPYVILDKTAFYPEGGGQPWDLGTINGCKVIKVLEEEGKIFHYLESSIDVLTVEGEVDWSRRFDHMQQHLGQHILSGVFERLLDGETVGFHLGEEYVTVDIALDKITKEQLDQVEEEANKVVYNNLDVKAYYVDSEQVKTLPMRKLPKVEEDIRIVEVGGYDYSGYGGTHPKNTGEVGIIKIIRREKAKGNVRVEFLCGKRALKDYGRKNDTILESSALLSRPFYELKDGIEVAKDQISKLTKENKVLKDEVNRYRVEELYAKASSYKDIKILSHLFLGEDFGSIANMATKLTEKGKVVVLFAKEAEKSQFIFTCSKDVEIDMNALLKEILPMVNGTGGGNKFRAQGGTTGREGIEKALEEAVSKLTNQLK